MFLPEGPVVSLAGTVKAPLVELVGRNENWS